jgi:hypothetical protein
MIDGVYSYEKRSFGRDHNGFLAKAGLVRPKSLGTAPGYGHARSVDLSGAVSDALGWPIVNRQAGLGGMRRRGLGNRLYL